MRSFKSLQTGMIHKEERIPLYENLCFILSLFRTHKGESIEEGKLLLKRILGFFSEGFPLYLHEYPEKGSASHQIRCSLPLYWISKLYHHVIPSPLKEKIEEVKEQLIDQDRKELSSIYQILYDALHGKEPKTYHPQFSHEWGLLLLAYQILDEHPSWILEGALEWWHAGFMTYSGPAIQEYQQKGVPEVNLYDQFMAEHQGEISKRIENEDLLQKALVFPFKKQYQLKEPNPFQVLEKNTLWSPKGFHLMRLLWGTKEQLHSLVCQDELRLSRVENHLFFTYPDEVPDEKNRMELSLFTEHSAETTIFIEGKKQTVFYLGETVEIKTKTGNVQLIFTLEEGEGQFLGHISRGNRPCQIGIEKEGDFSSYDWKIGLRSLSRSSSVKIGLRVLELRLS
jgi:hypothetical protein